MDAVNVDTPEPMQTEETEETEETDEPEGAGVGPPGGTTYTVHFPEGGPVPTADLEHVAPLPRVGDAVEYIDGSGTCHRYVVTDVIHTLQAAPAERPRVAEGSSGSAALATDQAAEPRVPETPFLRAGLPKVILGARTHHEASDAGGDD